MDTFLANNINKIHKKKQNRKKLIEGEVNIGEMAKVKKLMKEIYRKQIIF